MSLCKEKIEHLFGKSHSRKWRKNQRCTTYNRFFIIINCIRYIFSLLY